MDIANEVAQYIANAGFGTYGTDIFVAQIPSDTNGIYVSPSGGIPNDYVPIEQSFVDIYVKNTSSSTAATTINQIKRFIHRMHNTEINNAYIYTLLVIGDVEDVERDLEYGKLYKITVEVVNRDTTLIS